MLGSIGWELGGEFGGSSKLGRVGGSRHWLGAGWGVWWE